MKSISKLTWLILMITISLVACRGDQDEQKAPTMIPVTPQKIEVSASVLGVVKDQSGNAIADAKISIDGNTITETDENGAFVTAAMTLNSLGSNIVVEKSGYFLGSKFVQPQEGGTAYTELTLVTRTSRGTIDAASGGTISANGGATVQLSPNGIKDSNGNVYTGQVNVFAHWYDPAGANLVSEMPGDLRAVNSNNEFQQLGTYGMMAVELESPSGEALNVADGETAALSFPVPSAMEGAAPATIPLWFFDESSGYWLEDGSATKVGSTYSAEVSHFTWWNCDILFDFVLLTGTVTDNNGNPMGHLTLKFTDSNALSGCAFSNYDGTYAVYVPKNEPLTVEINDFCGDFIHTDNLGPYAADAMHDIQVTGSSNDMITLTATLEACPGSPALTEGYIKVDFGGGDYHILGLDGTGIMNYTFYNCNAVTSAIITGVDFNNNLFSTPVTISIPTSGTVDFGTLVTCEVNPESWDFTIDGNMGFAVEMNIGMDAGLNASGWGPDSNYVSFQIQSFTGVLGDYTPDNINVSVEIGPQDWDYIWCQQACSDVTISITEFGMVGERIKGNWSGSVTDPAGVTKATTGDFDLIRDY